MIDENPFIKEVLWRHLWYFVLFLFRADVSSPCQWIAENF
jgi:hypothetical protein